MLPLLYLLLASRAAAYYCCLLIVTHGCIIGIADLGGQSIPLSPLVLGVLKGRVAVPNGPEVGRPDCCGWMLSDRSNASTRSKSASGWPSDRALSSLPVLIVVGVSCMAMGEKFRDQFAQTLLISFLRHCFLATLVYY